ncbi:MAG: translation initiation factor Sui1 [Hydrogenophaga sp.]
MKSKHSTGGLVYSTEAGRMCPGCRQPVANCTCHQRPAVPASDGVARVLRETKGRGGKAVTVVKGVGMEPAALVALGKQLRTTCGSGGTVKDGLIEIQGDHVERVLAALQAQGIKAKRAGG